MIYINITSFVLISLLEKDDSMIETRCLKNVVIFFQSILYSYTFSKQVLSANKFIVLGSTSRKNLLF